MDNGIGNGNGIIGNENGNGNGNGEGKYVRNGSPSSVDVRLKLPSIIISWAKADMIRRMDVTALLDCFRATCSEASTTLMICVMWRFDLLFGLLPICSRITVWKGELLTLLFTSISREEN